MLEFLGYILVCAGTMFCILFAGDFPGDLGEFSIKDALVGVTTLAVLIALYSLYRHVKRRIYQKRHPFRRNPQYLTEEDDWRLMRGQEAYLKGVTLKKQAYQPIPPNDHDHCEFCMEKFSANHLTEGYCTLDEKIWICPACYAEFQKQFAWKLEQ